jgi:hypothetical protein
MRESRANGTASLAKLNAWLYVELYISRAPRAVNHSLFLFLDTASAINRHTHLASVPRTITELVKEDIIIFKAMVSSIIRVNLRE